MATTVTITGRQFKLAPGVSYQGPEGDHHRFHRNIRGQAQDRILIEASALTRTYQGEHITGFGSNFQGRVCTRQ